MPWTPAGRCATTSSAASTCSTHRAFRRCAFAPDSSRSTATAWAGATGELTLRDVTRPVAVRVERMDCRAEDRAAERCGVAVVSSIRRSDFGMDFALPFVGDEVALSFQLSARRVSP
ncbi:MAG TPA: YceI family protein [Casimicrobiaceae bacterium]|nr:YceI family protein [Casimicrobiaceae bacterium]